jgi:hypothetical protein
MNTISPIAPDFDAFTLASVVSGCQRILNHVVAAAQRAADRSRFAATPRRQLDDVGMTPADLDRALPGAGASDPRNAPIPLALAA